MTPVPTVTPFPTFTPFPTPAGTPVLNMAPAVEAFSEQFQANQIGPQVVQWWNMTIGLHWQFLSGVLLIVIVMGVFFRFYYKFKNEDI